MNFKIISDGACDLLSEYTLQHDVTIVPFYVTFDGTTYFKEGSEINHDDFYKKMDVDHLIPKSSLPSVDDYMEAFLPFVKQDIPIICICITSKFSGSYNSAVAAKSQILENIPMLK